MTSTINRILLLLPVIAFPFGGVLAQGTGEINAFKKLFGENVHPIGHPLNVNIGDMKGGKLFVYDKFGLDNYGATYVYNGKQYDIVSEHEDEAGHVSLASVFNVTHEGKYCLVFLNVHSAPWSTDANYDGNVYCMSGSEVIRQDALSRQLVGVKNAKDARAALKPML